MKETVYLLKSPKNASRLLESIKEIEKSKTFEIVEQLENIQDFN